MSPQSPLPSFEYEDIIFPKRTDFSLKLTDLLARESDVTVSNQVTPLTEYRGFALHLVVSLLHLVWLLWTFLPKSWLNKMGVYYYPSRWWSLAISSYVLMLMLYIYLALQLWNIEVETIKRDDLRVICDDDAVIEKDTAKYGWQDTNGVYDLRITDVNNVLYGD
jgi:phosphatidylinositol glycan class P protein